MGQEQNPTAKSKRLSSVVINVHGKGSHHFFAFLGTLQEREKGVSCYRFKYRVIKTKVHISYSAGSPADAGGALSTGPCVHLKNSTIHKVV